MRLPEVFKIFYQLLSLLKDFTFAFNNEFWLATGKVHWTILSSHQCSVYMCIVYNKQKFEEKKNHKKKRKFWTLFS